MFALVINGCGTFDSGVISDSRGLCIDSSYWGKNIHDMCLLLTVEKTKKEKDAGNGQLFKRKDEN